MSLQVHLQLITPVCLNLSIIRSRTTFVCLVICTGQYLVRRKRNRKQKRTDGEDIAYVRTYTRAQAEVAYIEGSVSHFRFRVRVRFRFRFRRTRYCPVHMTRHTKVVRLRIIDRLCQTGVSSCK